MKNNGFTIIELLIVIVVIGIVGSAASIGANKIINNKKEIEYKNYLDEIKDTACNMVSLSSFEDEIITVDNLTLKECKEKNYCKINTDLLIKSAQISENLKNPKDNTYLKDNSVNVEIKWDDGLKTCFIEGE